MDPYRNNLTNRIGILEERVDELTEKSKGQKGAVLWAVRKTIAENLSSSDWWCGFSIVTIILALIIGVPSCLKSCGDTPEEIRARQEVEVERIEQYKSSCDALGLKFIGHDNNRDKLTCGDKSTIVIIDLDDGQIDLKIIDPNTNDSE